MSSIRDALRARIDGDVRASTKIKIYLDPDAADRLNRLETEAAELRNQAAEGGRARKMNGRLGDLGPLIEEAEKALLSATAFIVLRALSSDQLAAATAGVAPDDPISKLWRAGLRASFVRVEDLDEKPVDDITAEDWGDLLETMSATEVQACHAKLQAADTEINPR